MSSRLFHRLILIYQFRFFLLALVKKELKVRYTQSLLGFSWMILEPLILVITFSTIFYLMDRRAPEGAPFPIFFYAAILPWNLFLGCLTGGARVFVVDKVLLEKIAFPREISVIKHWTILFVEYVFSSSVFVLLLFFYGYFPKIIWLLVPLFLAWLSLFGVGLMFLLASLNVYLRDIEVLARTLGRVWFWFTPIVFVLPFSGPTKIIYYVNPVAGPVSAIRDIVVYNRLPAFESLLSAMVATVLVVFVGYYVFRRLERNFIDVI